ncbi:MAG: RecX family transcriptional regulator [bacterium]|nr:RecX family transcriptional regulator [bacterium]
MGLLFDERRKDLMAKVLPAMNRFLASRERSSGEVIEQLKRKSLCFEEDYDLVLEILSEDGLLDDRRFVRNRAEHRLDGGYGPAYIRNDLMKYSVPREILQEVLAEFDESDYLEAAMVAVQKKERAALAKDDPERTMRSALQYRGFTYQQTEKAIRRWNADDSEDAGEEDSDEF